MNIIIASNNIGDQSWAGYDLDTRTDIVVVRLNSDHEFNPEPTGCEHHVLSGDVVYDSDTEVINMTSSVSGGTPSLFPGAGEAIEDVNGFEHETSHL